VKLTCKAVLVLSSRVNLGWVVERQWGGGGGGGNWVVINSSRYYIKVRARSFGYDWRRVMSLVLIPVNIGWTHYSPQQPPSHPCHSASKISQLNGVFWAVGSRPVGMGAWIWRMMLHARPMMVNFVWILAFKLSAYLVMQLDIFSYGTKANSRSMIQ